MIILERATTDESLLQILELQRQNLKRNVPEDKLNSQGFVTAEHTFEQLKYINDAENAIIATDNTKVVAYAIAMKKETGVIMPVFDDLFAQLDKITYDGKPVNDYSYIIIGQLCIQEDYRGQGLLEKLYAYYKNELEEKYELGITDISSLNPRSLKAHEKNGYVKIHTFFDDFTNSFWDIVVSDFRKK